MVAAAPCAGNCFFRGSPTSDGGGDGAGTGRGLLGIRERVELYGGCLSVGRRDEGGFVVRASLPVGAATL
jgi:signal transduction histidine kinase